MNNLTQNLAISVGTLGRNKSNHKSASGLHKIIEDERIGSLERKYNQSPYYNAAVIKNNFNTMKKNQN
jgi:hypothetical protein